MPIFQAWVAQCISVPCQDVAVVAAGNFKSVAS